MNLIRDNLWMEDFKTIREIASLVFINSDISLIDKPGTSSIESDEISKVMIHAETKQYEIRNLRKIAKNEDEKNPRSWMSKNAHDYFKENKISMQDYVVGTILLRLKNYSQECEIEGNPSGIISKRDKYKFNIINHESHYEVRSLPMSKFKIPNEKDIEKIATLLQMYPSYVKKNDFASIIRFFSNVAYVESTVLSYTIMLKIILRTEDVQGIEKISDTILSFLAT